MIAEVVGLPSNFAHHGVWYYAGRTSCRISGASICRDSDARRTLAMISHLDRGRGRSSLSFDLAVKKNLWISGWEREIYDLPCKVAALSILRFPMIAVISIRPSMSSFDWNIGNFLLRKNNRITPADQTSTAIINQKEKTHQHACVHLRIHERRTPSLCCAFQQHLRSAKAPRSSSICLVGWSPILF